VNFQGMELPAALVVLLALVMPGLVGWVMRSMAPQWRQWFAFIVCSAIGILGAWMMHLLSFQNVGAVLGTIGVVYTLANLAYEKFWKPYVLGRNSLAGPL